MDYFDGNRAFHQLMLGQVNLAHPAAAKLADDFVMIECPADHRLIAPSVPAASIPRTSYRLLRVLSPTVPPPESSRSAFRPATGRTLGGHSS